MQKNVAEKGNCGYETISWISTYEKLGLDQMHDFIQGGILKKWLIYKHRDLLKRRV